MLVPSIFENNFVDDMFDTILSVPFSFTGSKSKTPISGMNADVKEFEDKYLLDLELPGYKKEDIQAEVKDGYLTINASHSDTREEKEDGKYIRRERFVGKCQRSFYVGDAVTHEDIQAKFEDGILELTIPKKTKQPEVEEHKYIAIG